VPGVACEHEYWTGLEGEKTEKKAEEKDREKYNAETQRARRGAESEVEKPTLPGRVEELEDGVGGAVDGSGGAETVADFG
jgi:hypothetical protein